MQRFKIKSFLDYTLIKKIYESACNSGDLFDSWVGKILWRRERLPTPVFMGFPGGSDSKESAHNVGDLGSVPGLGKSPGEGKGYPLQHSGLENSMDSIVHGVARSQTRLSDFPFHFANKRHACFSSQAQERHP